MGAAHDEFEVRLDEAYAAAHFMDRAYRLRPRIGQAIRWDGPEHEVNLLRAFIVDDASREEEILSALFVRSLAAFERYLRKACSEVADDRAKLASTSGSLPPELKTRNLILTARLLGSLDNPRDHISFNRKMLVERLAACEMDSVPYELNSISFSAFLQSPTVDAVEKIFANVGLKGIFEDLGRSTALQRMFNTQGTRSASTRIQERLGEIVRWRNNFAHGGDYERSLTITDFDSVVGFLRTIAAEIDQTIAQKLTQGFV